MRTCLYLGPGGGRCAHAALDDGFCEAHGGAAEASARTHWLRRAAAALMLLLFLWIALADVLWEVFSWFR